MKKDIEELVAEVSAKAMAENKRIDFEFWGENDSPQTGWSQSRYGTAHPCGCVGYSTILSDGSLGGGGWTDSCWEHMN